MPSQGSYFKGWLSLQPAKGLLNPIRDSVVPLFGQVLDIIYESSDPESVGMIRVKVYNQSNSKSEDDIVTAATPADRNIIKYPVPGEIVLLKYGLTDKQSDGHIVSQLFYTTVMSSAASVNYNSNPYYMESIGRDTATETFTKEFEKRFEQKLINQESFIQNGKIISRPQLRPFEGDFIIQSRWGSTIRLGSTGFKEKNQWSKKGGLSGNPITIIRVNRSTVNGSVVENVDKDDSSLYMCSRQVIPVTLAVSKKLKSFAYVYDVSPVGMTVSTIDKTAFVESPFQDSPLYFAMNSPGNAPAGSSTADSLNLQGAAKLAYELLIEREGTILEAMWDVSNWRIGHGSSTITTEAGLVVKLDSVKASWPTGWANKETGQLIYTNIGNEVDTKGQAYGRGSIWKSSMSNRPQQPLITQKEADLDLARRIAQEFLPDARKSVNNDVAWEAIGPGAQAALVSIKYNYGNIHSSRTFGSKTPAEVARQGDRNVLANYIQNEMPGGSKERHAVEAQYARMA